MRTLPELLAHDTVPGSRTEFFALVDEAQAQLRPEGFLELHFAAEVVRDTWRLNLMAAADESRYSDETIDARNRYRDRLNTSVRRNTMELRRLQTDRILKERADLDLPTPVSTRDVLRFEKTKPNCQAAEPPQEAMRKNEPKPDPVQATERLLHAQIEDLERAELAEYAAQTKQVPRNAPCPCKSGEKYKRCCGKDAPPLLNLAA